MSKYDPSKKYQWKREDVFEMNGNEFMEVLNAARSVLSTPEAQKILMIANAEGVMQEVLARAVEKGIAIEAQPEQ